MRYGYCCNLRLADARISRCFVGGVPQGFGKSGLDATVNFVSGKYITDLMGITGNKQQKTSEKIAPWTFVNSINKGFQEVPKAVKEGYSYEQLLKESNNPDSFLYRYSLPIGFGLDIFADPTTYLTFGTSSAAKNVALKAMANAERDAGLKAERLIAKGEFAPHQRLEAIAHVKMNDNLPWTVGDGMAGLADPYELKMKDMLKLQRQRELAYKAEARRGKYGLHKMVTGWVLPTNVKFGSGVRFAGLEVPGTPALGRKLSGIRRTLPHSEQLDSKFIPDHALRHTPVTLDARCLDV
jgi:hypothetical protein